MPHDRAYTIAGTLETSPVEVVTTDYSTVCTPLASGYWTASVKILFDLADEVQLCTSH